MSLQCVIAGLLIIECFSHLRIKYKPIFLKLFFNFYFFVTYFLVMFEALHPSQQFLAMSECFPGLKMKYLAQGYATVTLMRIQITTLGLRVPESNQLS